MWSATVVGVSLNTTYPAQGVWLYLVYTSLHLCSFPVTIMCTNLPLSFQRYKGIYFPTIMLFSVFLGLLGVDRFCMGYCSLGVAKLLTLGGLGVWWIVDVLLLLTGNLTPEGGYNWDRYY